MAADATRAPSTSAAPKASPSATTRVGGAAARASIAATSPRGSPPGTVTAVAPAEVAVARAAPPGSALTSRTVPSTGSGACDRRQGPDVRGHLHAVEHRGGVAGGGPDRQGVRRPQAGELGAERAADGGVAARGQQRYVQGGGATHGGRHRSGVGGVDEHHHGRGREQRLAGGQRRGGRVGGGEHDGAGVGGDEDRPGPGGLVGADVRGRRRRRRAALRPARRRRLRGRVGRRAAGHPDDEDGGSRHGHGEAAHRSILTRYVRPGRTGRSDFGTVQVLRYCVRRTAPGRFRRP